MFARALTTRQKGTSAYQVINHNYRHFIAVPLLASLCEALSDEEATGTINIS